MSHSTTTRSGLRAPGLTLTFILMLAGSGAAAPLHAAVQTDVQDTSAANRLNALVEDERRQAEDSADAAPPTVTPAATAGVPSEPALAYADPAELAAYATWGLEHRRRVFEWQYRSSRIIFFAVLFLVFTGVSFSGIQFYRAMREPVAVDDGGGRERKTATDAAGPEGTVSHIELSTGGVKISSPVLGVIILGLSLAFFYLYLVFVYPIAETF